MAEQTAEYVALDSDRFPSSYKARMIAAYPVIAGMSADEAYFADRGEREAAFGRILASRNLRRTHELFLCECPPCPGRGNDGHGMQHCAECCFGTGVEADLDCPIHGIRPGSSEGGDSRG